MPAPLSPHRSLGRLLNVAGGWPRRVAAVLCMALAAASALRAPPAAQAGPTIAVLVAARNLPAGAVLQANDVRSVTWPQANAPLAAIHEASRALGRPIGGQMSKGEPITTARMLDTTIVSGLTAGQVAATVTLPTAGQAAILLAGAVIDLYLGGAEDSMVNDRPIVAQGTSRLIAPSVRILAVLSVQDATGPQPLSIVLAVDRLTASQLANHPSGPFLATLRRPS